MNGACQRAGVVAQVRHASAARSAGRRNVIVGRVRREQRRRDRRGDASDAARTMRRCVTHAASATRRSRADPRAPSATSEKSVPKREEQRAGAGAAGDQIDVARAQRVEHQACRGPATR